MSVYISDPTLIQRYYFNNGTPTANTLLVGSPNYGLSQSFSEISTWFKTQNSSSTYYYVSQQSYGEIVKSAFTSVTGLGTKNDIPGPEATAILIGPGSLTGAGTVGTVAVDGSFDLNADITTSYFVVGIDYTGSPYYAPHNSFTVAHSIYNPSEPSEPVRTYTESETIFFQPGTLSSPNSDGVVLNFVSPAVFIDNNGTSTYYAPKTFSSVTYTSNQLYLSGSVTAVTGNLAFSTVDVTGALVISGQEGLGLTFGSILDIQSGGTVQASAITLGSGQGNAITVETGGLLSITGAAGGGTALQALNGDASTPSSIAPVAGSNSQPEGLNIIGNIVVSGGTLESPNAAIDIGVSGAGTLQIIAAGHALTGYTEIGDQGMLIVSGGTFVGTTGSSLVNNGELTVDTAGYVSVGSISVGEASGNLGNALINGSTVDVSDALTVGGSGTGNVTIISASTVNVLGEISVGESSGANGALALSDSDLTADTLTVGGSGNGETSAGVNSNIDVTGEVSIGESIGATGTLALSASTLTADSLTVGSAGDGQGTVGAGATADVAGEVSVGESGSGTGLLAVYGALSAGTLTVGSEGVGTVSVGGNVGVVGEVSVGESASGIGTLAVEGGVLAADTLTIGSAGSGTASIVANGAVDVSGEVSIGESAGASGSLIMTASALTAATLTVGSDGNGQAAMSGSTISVADEVSAGESVNATGSLDLTSTNLTAGTLTVGSEGTGQADISAASAVNVLGEVSVGESGSGNGSITVDAATLDAGTLTVGSAGTGAFSDGGNVAVTGEVSVGESAGGVGVLTVAAGVLSAGTLTVGSSGNGAAMLGPGAILGIGGEISIGESIGAIGAVAASGGEVTAATLTVGSTGNGQADFAGAVVVIGGEISVGESLGGIGALTLASGSATAGTFTVGAAGIGAATIAGGATAGITGNVTVGDSAGAAGTIDVNGSKLTATALTVGSSGRGSVSIASASSVSVSGKVTLGESSSGSGVLTIAAGQATFGGNLVVGDGGTGNLQDNGTLNISATDISVGESASATGTLSVAGTLTATNATMTVGAAGKGTLSLSGTASLATLTLGDSVSATGILSISAGALEAQDVSIGNKGSGIIYIAGGSFSAQTIAIGASGGSDGTLAVSGNGTLVTATSLFVGGSDGSAGGQGTVSIGSSSTVSVTNASIFSSGVVTLSGGALVTDPLTIGTGGVIEGAGTLTGSITNSGSIVAVGGLLDVTGAISEAQGVVGSLALNPESTLEIGGSLASGLAIDFGGGANETLIIETPGSGNSDTLTGLAAGDQIALNGLSILAASYDSAQSDLTLSLTGGASYIFQDLSFAKSTPPQLAITTLVTGNEAIEIQCFAAGTLIETKTGPIAVEALRSGICVKTLSGEAPIRWIGWRTIDLSRHPNRPAVQPIRIAPHAFAPGSPSRWLRLSPDHAVLIDDLCALVPIRMLVNGGTIVADNYARSITYYHVELDRHDVLIAEGLAAESYLDTGNRGNFANANGAISLVPDFSEDREGLRVRGSCWPFMTQAEMVEKIWLKLAKRSAALGYRPELPALSRSPELAVVRNNEVIAPQVNGSRYSFKIDTGGPLILRSRAASPADVRPWIDDRRCLGVAITRLAYSHKTTSFMHECPINDPTLRVGWYLPEQKGELVWRWTDGNAAISLPCEADSLYVDLHATGLYPANSVTSSQATCENIVLSKCARLELLPV
ncbi:hypothetical protein ACOSOMT5_P3026 [Acidiphilium sp. MT5]